MRPAWAWIAAVALVLAGLGACSSDDDGITPTPGTEDVDGEDGIDSGLPGVDESGDPGPDTGPSTTSTTMPTGAGRPLNESDLVDDLLAPEAFGEGFGSDDSLGPGDLSPDLCPDVSVEVTWDDQASQNLIRGQGDEMVIVNQSILDFADDATADAFFDSLLEAITTCDPELAVEELGEPGDRAVSVDVTREGPAVSGALLRVGDRVNYLLALGAADTELGIVTPEVLAEVASALAD